jgi:hypothetical protein
MCSGRARRKLSTVNPLPHPTVELVVDGSRSDGAYAVLDICLPGGLDIPRHVRRGHSGVAHLLDGALELREDDEVPVIVRRGLIRLPECRPIAVRVLEAARLVAVLVPAGAANLIPAAVDPLVLPDDRAALLAAAGITALPAIRIAK